MNVILKLAYKGKITQYGYADYIHLDIDMTNKRYAYYTTAYSSGACEVKTKSSLKDICLSLKNSGFMEVNKNDIYNG